MFSVMIAPINFSIGGPSSPQYVVSASTFLLARAMSLCSKKVCPVMAAQA